MKHMKIFTGESLMRVLECIDQSFTFQDSHQNTIFLMLVILIWFLPVCVHVASRTLAHHGLERFKNTLIQKLTKTSPRTSPAAKDFELRSVSRASEDSSRVKTRKSVSKVLDMVLQLLQLTTFLATFR